VGLTKTFRDDQSCPESGISIHKDGNSRRKSMKISKRTNPIMHRTTQTLIALSLGIAGSTVQASTQCYTFDNLEDGRTFVIGDQKQLNRALITFYNYYDENLDPVAADGLATVSNSGIIGSPPVLTLNHRILVQVIPDQRIKRVRIDYAENTGVDNNQIVNLGINNEIKAWRGTLTEMDGKKLGPATGGGLVSVSVTQTPVPNSYWVTGTVQLVSDPADPNLPDRGIDRFALGRSSQLQIDNVCLETF
jgi:hypothetical protein